MRVTKPMIERGALALCKERCPDRTSPRPCEECRGAIVGILHEALNGQDAPPEPIRGQSRLDVIGGRTVIVGG